MMRLFSATRAPSGAKARPRPTSMWISPPGLKPGPRGGPYVLNISADAQYIVYLNGRYVNGGQYADFPSYKVYDALDLTPFVRPGGNILKIGGYCPVTDSSTYRLGHPSVIFAVKNGEDFVLESGEDTLCAADPCYKSGAVDKVSGQLGYSFEYDARPDSFFAGETIDESAMERAILAPMPEAYYPRPIRKLDLLPRRPGRCAQPGRVLGRPGRYRGPARAVRRHGLSGIRPDDPACPRPRRWSGKRRYASPARTGRASSWSST